MYIKIKEKNIYICLSTVFIVSICFSVLRNESIFEFINRFTLSGLICLLIILKFDSEKIENN